MVDDATARKHFARRIGHICTWRYQDDDFDRLVHTCTLGVWQNNSLSSAVCNRVRGSALRAVIEAHWLLLNSYDADVFLRRLITGLGAYLTLAERAFIEWKVRGASEQWFAWVGECYIRGVLEGKLNGGSEGRLAVQSELDTMLQEYEVRHVY